MPDVEITQKIDAGAIERQITNHVRRQIGAWLRALYKDVLDSFETAKHGAPGPRVRRSAPGEAPARQSGHLASTVHPFMIGSLSGALEIDEPYGAFLNDGLLSGRILPRPIVKPALEHFFAEEASGALDVRGGVL